MNRDELDVMVLVEVAQQCAAIRARPRPPVWQSWSRKSHDADRELGPRYTPTWFPDVTTTEAGRVRVLRAVYRLANAGLLAVVKSEGGRLERVNLTETGKDAVAELLKAEASQ